MKLKRLGPGRPKMPLANKANNHSITLLPGEHARLMSIGAGSLTRGIKLLLAKSRIGRG